MHELSSYTGEDEKKLGDRREKILRKERVKDEELTVLRVKYVRAVPQEKMRQPVAIAGLGPIQWIR